MEFWYFIIFLFAVLIPLVLCMFIPIYREHKKVTGNVINYDPHMRKFVYKVYMTEEEILRTLMTTSQVDELSCRIDREKSKIIFSEYGSNRPYTFRIQACDGFSILHLDQIPLFGMQSNVPLKLNPFMVKKLQAEIVPYSLYGN